MNNEDSTALQYIETIRKYFIEYSAKKSLCII